MSMIAGIPSNSHGHFKVPDLDSLIPAHATDEQGEDYVSGFILRSLASTINGLTSKDIDRVGMALATGEPVWYGKDEAMPASLIGPGSLAAMSGALYGALNEDDDVGEGAPKTNIISSGKLGNILTKLSEGLKPFIAKKEELAKPAGAANSGAHTVSGISSRQGAHGDGAAPTFRGGRA